RQGSEGERLVTYQIVTRNGTQVEKKVIEQQVLKEPVTKIVERGTRVVLASRSGGSGRLAWPIQGTITSPYGYRGREFHTGLDIAGSIGEPVGAAEDGTVTFVGYDGGYGRMIAIDHGGGLVTRYAHLSGYNVRSGQQVSRGQVIGYVGVSGRTTGPHLHFEVLVNGSFRNPYEFLK
ncbi:MAG: peptidoglycan DD-metalloendopeptidase family protein, partial [Moorella sp. (in: Bacteria)]|nr:peptidoglycan DD-metalloendopeptidase family protein [Moorella sp. (in: firmicutes)]